MFIPESKPKIASAFTHDSANVRAAIVSTFKNPEHGVWGWVKSYVEAMYFVSSLKVRVKLLKKFHVLLLQFSKFIRPASYQLENTCVSTVASELTQLSMTSIKMCESQFVATIWSSVSLMI